MHRHFAYLGGGLIVLAFVLATPLFAQETEEKEVGEAGEEGIVVLDGGIADAEVEKRPYASYVTECVDLLMEYGTDRYGLRLRWRGAACWWPRTTVASTALPSAPARWTRPSPDACLSGRRKTASRTSPCAGRMTHREGRVENKHRGPGQGTGSSRRAAPGQHELGAHSVLRRR